ncbi:ABC transporter substrate-binding protein [Congregibacter brevis]|uniref:ABC transporter substrate-binding protein n=1 Tax=Congregibacter brevis TaxID=3081201 RepID=A0ABZ0I782_9GAMM|nr:ABC transporter substrate-binding protein [Congregibacter sp. IMCC45268]
MSLADEFKWLPEGVVLRRTASGVESMEALRSGEVQVAALTLDEALRLRSDLPKIAIVLVMDESAGADVVLAKAPIKSVRDLERARVAVELGTVSEFLLRMALDAEDLSLEDIEVIDLSGSDLLAAFEMGDVDAVVAYPPMTDDIVALGATRIFDSSEASNTIFDVLVVNRPSLINRQEVLSQVIAAHFKALDYLDRSPDDAVYRYAEYQGSSAAEVKATLTKVRLPRLQVVRAFLAPDGAVEETAKQMLVEQIVSPSDADLSKLVDSQYLPRVLQ